MTSAPKFVIEEEGKRLRAAYQRLKKSKHVTQDSIAKACGWKNASTLNRLFYGKTALNADSLGRLSTVLGASAEYISPRLTEASSLEPVRHIYVPVSSVVFSTNSTWSEPVPTELRLPIHTSNASSFALIFDNATAPPSFGGWAVVVEPGSSLTNGDSVVVRVGKGKYAQAIVEGHSESGEALARIPGQELTAYPLSHCWLVAGLSRRSKLVDFRACLEIAS